MNKEDIKANVVYKNKKTGELGVLYLGYDYGCLGSNEVGIIYRGDDKNPKKDNLFFVGTDTKDLEEHVLKSEDMLSKKHLDEVCKLGKGEACCCYLILDPNQGFSCSRIDGNIGVASTIKERMGKGTMNAKGINCGGKYNF